MFVERYMISFLENLEDVLWRNFEGTNRSSMFPLLPGLLEEILLGLLIVLLEAAFSPNKLKSSLYNGLWKC